MREAVVMMFRGVRAALCACLVLAFAAGAFAAPATVVFSKDGVIFLTDSEGRQPVKLAEGSNPEISPDGRFVAFTALSGKDGGGRRITVAETASKKATILEKVPGENSYGPRWSPDGKSLLFNHWDEQSADWVFGTAALADGSFRVLAPEQKGIYSPFWSADGASVYGQDLDTLYRIDVASGAVVERRPLASVTGSEAMVSSALRFAVSADGSMWLFDAEVEDTGKLMKHGEPLNSAVFLHTPADGKTRRLTPETICAMHPSWLPGEKEFLFAGYGPKEAKRKSSPFAIFRQAFEDGKATLFIKEGESPSAGRKRSAK
jgi:dipeptidyl aminopeptidase/acylaminoacyl peptidase